MKNSAVRNLLANIKQIMGWPNVYIHGILQIKFKIANTVKCRYNAVQYCKVMH